MTDFPYLPADEARASMTRIGVFFILPVPFFQHTKDCWPVEPDKSANADMGSLSAFCFIICSHEVLQICLTDKHPPADAGGL